MKTIQNVWDSLNGNKTVIGGVILLFVTVVPQFQAIVGVTFIDAETLAVIQKAAEAIMGIGLVHKVQKAM